MTRKHPRYYTEHMNWIHKFADYFCKLAEERAMMAAEGRLGEDEGWFQHEFNYLKESIIQQLDSYVQEVAKQPANFWLKNYEERASRLMRCREDHLMQGNLTRGMDEEYKREIQLQTRKIQRIKATLEKKRGKETTAGPTRGLAKLRTGNNHRGTETQRAKQSKNPVIASPAYAGLAKTIKVNAPFWL